MTRLIVGVLVAVALMLAVAPAESGAASCAPHWVGSWSSSPSDASLLQPTLVNQTLRMIVAPHLGGSILRVHLSNRFGALPVTLGPITVGVRGSGASLVPGSERGVTFNGQTSVTIPAGGDVVSDAITLSFTAFQDLAVSVAVPGVILSASEHLSTRETSYLSPLLSGDHTAETSGSAFTQTTAGSYSTGWYFLDGIDVFAPGSVGAVVAFGDSITDGYQATASATEQLATIDTDGRYPDDLERRLIAANLPLSVLDAGIGGENLLASARQSGQSRFATDALAQAGVTDVIVLEGINDIGAGATASQLVAAYQQLIAQAHAAGVHIQLATLTPTGGSSFPGLSDANAEAVRNQVNEWIRTQQLSDGVIDFDAAVRDPSNPSQINPAYDGGDHIHLDLAGYQAIANAVQIASLARPQCGVVPPVARVSVSALRSAARTRRSFLVRWSASDTGGPGTAYFTVQVQATGRRRGRRPSAPRWRTLRGLAKTTKASVRFTGPVGDRYKFRVRATDTAGLAGRWATTRGI
jgi:lysophospholipase L1-like esterase